MSKDSVCNVSPMSRAFLANTRDRLVIPLNPASSSLGGRTQDRLPPPMRPVPTAKAPVVATTSIATQGRK